MPGSRDAEIASLWQPMQQIAVLLKRRYPGAVFTAVAVDEKKKEALKTMPIIGFRCQYVVGSVNEAALAADLTIVASGSATLQVAAAGCPMVIMYQCSKVVWHLLGRWLLKTKHLSLVNILAQKEMVPEFMPYFTSITPITQTVVQLLEDRDILTRISSELIDLVEPLGQASASQTTARIVIEMLESTTQNSSQPPAVRIAQSQDSRQETEPQESFGFLASLGRAVRDCTRRVWTGANDLFGFTVGKCTTYIGSKIKKGKNRSQESENG